MNVNDIYFDGMYKDIWRWMIPDTLTTKETDFLVSHFHLSDQSSVLDVMCGYGRHSISLAERGITACAVDNLKEYIDEIKLEATKKQLPIEAIQTDVSKLTLDSQFDLAICMGNSFNFFPKEKAIALLINLARNIKYDGHVLINSWSLTEIVTRDFTSKSWTEINGVKFLGDSAFELSPTRIETKTTMIAADLTMEEKLAVDYIYSTGEMEEMLDTAGFSGIEFYSIPGKKKFSLGDSRVYIVAQKKQST